MGRVTGRLLPSLLLTATALTGLPALAQQSGFAVAAGSATISTPSANTTIVRQTTNQAIITWNTLNVSRGGLLQFIQPSSSSIALNRVLGGSASDIEGSLVANGQVWIVNPAGVMFGHGASVNVAGLVATTSNISDANFLSGNYVFDQATADAQAAVVNRGTIQVAAGGAAVLAGARVTNQGLIEADLGKVVLASGAAFAVNFDGDNLISFAVSAPLAVTPLDHNGNPAQSLVSNSGTISATGGQVLLTAQAARSVLTNAINVTGMIEATSAHVENGEIVLDAGPNGSVTLGSAAVLDASGDQGGGTIAVSGGTVTVTQGALLDASAVTSGNGGTVTLQASDTLAFDGAITVEGGAGGGNGGLAETSGANVAVSTGTVDALAPAGAAGTWLLDPANITVESGGSASLSHVDAFGSDAGKYDTIDPSTLDGASANIVLQATHNIVFNAPVVLTQNGVGIEADAGNSITVSAASAITTRGGSITLTANAGASASGSGGITILAPLSTSAGNVAGGSVTLAVDGGSGRTTLGASITTAAGAISFTGPTVLHADVALDTTAGGAAPAGATITFAGTLDGPGAPDLTITAGSGDVDFEGRVGNDSSGVGNTPGAVTIATAGNVNMTMIAGANGDGFSAGALAISGADDVPGAASLTAASYVKIGGDIDIVTDGAVSIAGSVTAREASGAGGNVTITAGGAITVSGGSGSSAGISTFAGYARADGAVPGDGGAISLTGASITLVNGANSSGGNELNASSDASGGNAGAITLIATAGSVSIGTPDGNSRNGLTANGGSATNGLGGAGGNVLVSGQTLAIVGISANGGNSSAAGAGPGDHAGNITLVATATSGSAVTLYGMAATAADSQYPPTLSADGGATGAAGITGAAGNIVIEGSVAGAPLQGSSFIALASTSAGELSGGSVVNVSAIGGPSAGGAILIEGPVQATGAGVESFGIAADNGIASLEDAVGSVVALKNLFIGCCLNHESVSGDAGTVTFEGPVVAVGTIDDLRTSGSVTYAGMVTASAFTMKAGSTALAFENGATFGANPVFSGGPIGLDGTFTLSGAATGARFSGPVTLDGATTIDASAVNGSITFASTVDGSAPLDVMAGSGAVTFKAAVGSSVPLFSLTVASAATLDGDVTTIGEQFYGGTVTLGNDVTLSALGYPIFALSGAFDTGLGNLTLGPLDLINFTNGVNGAGWNLTVANGTAELNGSIQLGSLSVQTADINGSITTSAGQTYNGPVSLTGDTTLADRGSGIVFASTVTGESEALTVTKGATTFENTVDLGSLAVQGASIDGAIATAGSQSYAGPIALLSDVTLAASGSGASIVISGTSTLATGFALNALATGNIAVSGTLENSGAGAITLVAGWDGVTAAALAPTTAGAFGLAGGTVSIGGSGAAGNAAIGSAGGTATVAAANLTLNGTHGFAQLGYVGSGATGNIAVTLTGNLVMTAGAAGDYAQIGHGGAGTSGSETGTIGIAATGNITLTAGAGADAYAQIGHGGALSNFGATVAFGDTGDISLSGAVVTLVSGLGSGAYVQVGHGGLDAGESASLSSGSILISGNIDLNATSQLVMTGSSGISAYAQIGNGGFGANAHATVLSGGTITETGDIVISTGTAASSGAIALTGDAYAQIGNGGYQENTGASASGGISEGGNISLSLAGGSGQVNAGSEGDFAYAQVGNGDAAHTGAGNVSGNIDVSSSGPWQLNSSSTAPAWMWNATGSGTVSGGTQIDGSTFLPTGFAPPPPPPPNLDDQAGLNSFVTSNQSAPPVLSNDNPTPVSASGLGTFSEGPSSDSGTSSGGSNLAQTLNAIVPTAGPSSGAGAIEQMTQNSGGPAAGPASSGEAPAGAGQEADDLSSAVALSLTGKASVPGGASQVSSCIRSGSGTAILCELAPEPGVGKTPVGVQPADQPYSSWGNESLWQQ